MVNREAANCFQLSVFSFSVFQHFSFSLLIPRSAFQLSVFSFSAF